MSGVPVHLTLTHLAAALKNDEFDGTFKLLSIDERIVLAAALIHAHQGQPTNADVARLARVNVNVFSPSKPEAASRLELIAHGVELATTLLGAHTGQTVGDLQAELTKRDVTIAEQRAARKNWEHEQELLGDYLKVVDDEHRPFYVDALTTHDGNVVSESAMATKRHLRAVHESDAEEHSDS